MSLNKEDDRRRFFRINDAIGISYERLDEDASEIVEHVEESISVKELLEHHNVAISTALSQLEVAQPETATVIAELNRKMDTLLALFELDDLSGHSHFQQFQQASISACGVGFPAKENIEPDTLLKITLFLQPSGAEVMSQGKVISCHEVEGESYYLRVEFTLIAETDRERLIQHIVQRQSSLLKALREQLED